MKLIRIRLALVAILLLAFSAPLFAQQSDIEQFRSELLAYVAGIGRLPAAMLGRGNVDSSKIAQAEQSIRQMSVEELRGLKAQMDNVPLWRELPGVLAGIEQAAPLSPREVAMSIPTPDGPYNPEIVRNSMLAMVGAFRQIPAEYAHPDYRQHVDNLESIVKSASAADLIVLNEAVQSRIGGWNATLDGARAGTLTDSQREALKIGVNNHCTGGFPSNAICELNHIINDIAHFFTTTLPNTATSAFNSIKGIFNNVAGALPTSFNGMVNTLGLNNVNWTQVATTALDYVRLPCPPDGFLLPAFGRVGEIRTFTNYSGTIGFAGNAITELTPSDILTSADLQAIMIVINFPIQWLSRCLEESWDDNYKSAQSDHRDHVETNLDVVASTRVSQTSLDTAQGQTDDIDGDVAKVEAKLDRLDTTANRIEVKVDNLKLQQGQTNDALADFQKNMLRMLIEHDLVRQANTRISLFQLPSSVGGYLETVREIVSDTLASRTAAGLSMSKAASDLAAGDKEYSFGNFKAAYGFYRTAYQRAVN
jgi:flagellin-like hook-associated protein FlgL